MFCPKCGLEYREGFNECAYCHLPLVDELPDDFDPEAIQSATENMNDVSPEEINKESTEADAEQEEIPAPTKAFRTAAERANDMKSSGITLIFVAVLGIAFWFLCYNGALPITFSGPGAVMSYGVMGLLFVIFFIAGVRSMAKVNRLEEEADREQEKQAEIKEWFSANYSSEAIDEIIRSEEENNEDLADLYFERIKLMKLKISEHFVDIDTQFLDYVIEDLYTDIFEDK